MCLVEWTLVMPAELVEIARFETSAEAAIVRGRLEAEGIPSELAGEAVASWFWYYGPNIAGVRLLVAEEDVERVDEILRADVAIEDTEDVGFSEDPRDDAPSQAQLPDDLVRAWRASVIGLFALPPLLNLYSIWLLVRNEFFVEQCDNWRVAAACIANALALLVVTMFAYMTLAA